MARLKTLHAVFVIVVGILAVICAAAPQPAPSSLLDSTSVVHVQPSDTTHMQGALSKRDSPPNALSVLYSALICGAPSQVGNVVTVTQSQPPVPTVTSIQVITKITTPLPVTPTTTVTTLLPGPTSTVVVSPEEYSAWQAYLAREAATKEARSFHEEHARHVTVYPSKPSTTISPQSTCTDYGVKVACTPGSVSHPASMPKFDNSSISCHSSTISGLSLRKIKSLTSQVCPDFAHIDDSDSSPKISRISSDDGQEVTFQLDYSFAGHKVGSSFSLGKDACVEGFTHALSHCDDENGKLYQNGMVHATFQTVEMTFLTSVVESAKEKRDDQPEDLEMKEAPIISYLAFPPHLNYSGTIVVNGMAHDCQQTSQVSVCCAQGAPSTPAIDVSGFPTEFCGNLVKDGSLIFPAGLTRKRAAYGLSESIFANFGEANRPLTQSDCKILAKVLTSDCNTFDGQFTGGSATWDGWQLQMKPKLPAAYIQCDNNTVSNPNLDMHNATKHLCTSGVMGSPIGYLPVGIEDLKTHVGIKAVSACNETRTLHPGECDKIYGGIVDRCGAHSGVYYDECVDFSLTVA